MLLQGCHQILEVHCPQLVEPLRIVLQREVCLCCLSLKVIKRSVSVIYLREQTQLISTLVSYCHLLEATIASMDKCLQSNLYSLFKAYFKDATVTEIQLLDGEGQTKCAGKFQKGSTED